MVIYIDILFVINCFINYLILLLSAKFSGVSVHRKRLILSSVFAGACSLVVLLPDMGIFISSVFKIAIALIMTLIAFGKNTFRLFLRCFLCVFAVSFLFAGLFFAFEMLINPDKMLFINGTVYFDINFKAFVIFTCAGYVFIKSVLYFLKRKSNEKEICTVFISFLFNSVKLNALIDTGNSLSDLFSGIPVTTVEKKCFEKGFGKNTSEKYPERTGVIPVKTAIGSALLQTFRADKMIIEKDKKRWTVDKPVIALSSDCLSDGDYQALLNPLIFENGVMENEKNKAFNK